MVQRDENGRFIPSRNLTGLVGEGSGSSNNNPIENVINDVVSNTENVMTVGNIEETLSPSNIQLISAVFTGIPAFSGVRNSSKKRDFCDAVDATLDLAGVTPRQGLLLAVSRITGAAKSWLIVKRHSIAYCYTLDFPHNIILQVYYIATQTYQAHSQQTSFLCYAHPSTFVFLTMSRNYLDPDYIRELSARVEEVEASKSLNMKLQNELQSALNAIHALAH
ncbi:hypothetical protein HMI56_003882 [Coelomomyces lativittatus]|nr:hypothetical protein HMI56_003882 [Coelomomyces lativittatus]